MSVVLQVYEYIGGSGCPDCFAFDLLLAGDGAE